MIELGWKSVGVLELTALPSIDKERWVKWVREADVLLVNGGDALYLGYWIRESRKMAYKADFRPHQLLQQGVRKVDTVARWGGEEFMILCPDTDLAGACTVAESIRSAVARHGFATVGRKTCSFGVSEYRPGDSPHWPQVSASHWRCR